MKTNLKSDISLITTINERALDKLSDKVLWCISDAVEKAMLNNDNVIELDLGFGILMISILDNNVKYKFVPSKELEKAVNDTIINEKNMLVDVLEESLVNKITNVYKDMF